MLVTVWPLLCAHPLLQMAEFLMQHGGRTEEEAALLNDMLLWHRRTFETAQNDD